MAWEARSGLKPGHRCRYGHHLVRLNGLGSPFGIETSLSTTVALVEGKLELSPLGSFISKRAASSERLAIGQRPALRLRRSAPGSVPDAGCDCDCECVDVLARPREARAAPHGGR